MAKHMACRDAGMDCDFEITDENEDEVVDFVQIHARTAHDMSMSEDEVRDMLENT
jgi:predicted small metal-binding protein